MTNVLRNNSPKLTIREVTDLIIRKNFENLQAYFNAENQLLGFKFIEVIFTKAETNRRVKHGLSGIPQDIVRTLVTGAGTVTFNLGLFSSTELDLSSSGPCRVRFFVGTYWDSTATPFSSGDIVQASAPVVVDGAVAASSGSVPAGTILPFGGSTAPEGYLLCDGSSYSSETYPALFAAIGYSFGKPGSGLFNVPDSRGYFMRGRDNGAANDPDASSRTAMKTGGNTGDRVGSIQAGAVESHKHTMGGTTGNFQTNDTGAIRSLNPNAATYQTSNYGGNETRPKNFYVNYIIKT